MGMPLTDRLGVTWAHEDAVKEGDFIRADGGFSCIRKDAVLEVKRNPKYGNGIESLYVDCDDGQHFLDGALGADGELIGFYPDQAALSTTHVSTSVGV
jgi:hypothetical protein